VQDAIVDRFRKAMAVAAESIDSGAAVAKLDTWIAATNKG
jgi:anthranilate phosphoribosyltransferase